MTNTQDIPTGPTWETALDRMDRASNFASNGKWMIDNGAMKGDSAADRAATCRTYISAARVMLDEAEAAFVGAWRADGATWAEVGDLLRISRQAAQQRFGS